MPWLERVKNRLNRALVLVVGHLPPRFSKWVGALGARSGLTRRFLARATSSIRTTDVTIRHGECEGLRFNAGGSNPSYVLGVTEPLEQELLARTLREGSVFYDIGANVGFFTLLGARCVGATGRVVAFEPLPANVATLRRNMARNGFEHVTVVPAAVGRGRGTAMLELGEQPMWGRIVDRASTRPSVEVDLLTIDDLVAEATIPAPHYVKIDVEGSEADVLQGMRATIERVRPSILCEVHGTGAEVLPLLRELGYRLRWLEGDGPIEAAPSWFHVVADPLPVGAASRG